MFRGHSFKICLVGAALVVASTCVQAKGSSGGPGNPCNVSYLACPIVLTAGTGSLSDELVNNTFGALTLGVAYASPQVASGDLMSFALTGPGNGANLLPFLATAKINAFGPGNTLLFSLTASNYDPSGSGSSSYLNPSSQSLGGVTLSEQVSGFEGGITFDAVNQSGSPISLTVDLQIPASNYGQVTVTNEYALSSVPEPSSTGELVSGLVLTACTFRWRQRRVQACAVRARTCR